MLRVINYKLTAILSWWVHIILPAAIEKKFSILTEQRSDGAFMRSILLPDASNTAWNHRSMKKLAYTKWTLTGSRIKWCKSQKQRYFFITEKIVAVWVQRDYKTNDFVGSLVGQRCACQTSLEVQIYRIICKDGTSTNSRNCRYFDQ